jgi:hypothetical protein
MHSQDTPRYHKGLRRDESLPPFCRGTNRYELHVGASAPEDSILRLKDVEEAIYFGEVLGLYPGDVLETLTSTG